MALKSESASQMDHLQALEKVSPKLDLVKVDTEVFSSFVFHFACMYFNVIYVLFETKKLL